jgi:hypothetical protein
MKLLDLGLQDKAWPKTRILPKQGSCQNKDLARIRAGPKQGAYRDQRLALPELGWAKGGRELLDLRKERFRAKNRGPLAATS